MGKVYKLMERSLIVISVFLFINCFLIERAGMVKKCWADEDGLVLHLSFDEGEKDIVLGRS